MQPVQLRQAVRCWADRYSHDSSSCTAGAAMAIEQVLTVTLSAKLVTVRD